MTITIDKDTAVRLMHEVVEGNEDFVYDTSNNDCVYEAMGAPSCLIGQVLYKAGVSISVLHGFDVMPADSDIAALFEGGFLDKEGVEIPKDVVDAFSVAQTCQDTGSTWGQSLNEFEKHLAE